MQSNEELEKNWVQTFINYLQTTKHDQSDASHDLEHFRRVARTATCISLTEIPPVDSLVLAAAAYFHDIVCLPKNHPESKLSSRYSAEKAGNILAQLGFPKEKIDPVCHAILAHSFSAGVAPNTIEAKIIQDADRMEALGALGIMRTFYVSGRMRTAPYHPSDLFAKRRPFDDKAFALDHFYCKLFKLPDLFQTKGGRQIALKRAEFLELFVKELALDVENEGGAAYTVAWTCYHAGVYNGRFFDQRDPFAGSRALNPDFILDNLIKQAQRFPNFLDLFIDQIRTEIEV